MSVGVSSDAPICASRWGRRIRRILRRIHDDDGSAVVEYSALTLLLLVPGFYLILTLFMLQQASFAAEGAAREGARIYSEARVQAQAQAHMEALVQVAAADLNIDRNRIAVSTRCTETPCLTGEGLVIVGVTISQQLPLIPAFVHRFVPAEVAVSAESAAVVNPYLER
ncbi:MAG: hypothetical protein Q4B12_04580 [Bowdeniella nasicola]|nr:hypothetical protein [Bowdeniella nasicola]